MSVTLSDEQFQAIMGVVKSTLDRVEDLEERVESSEERVEDLEEKVEEASTDDHDIEEHEGVPEYDMTWIERLHHKGRDGVDSMPRRRDVHAKVLFDNLPDWAFKAQNGDIILKTADKLRQKMRRALGEDNFEYVQLYRACEALDERAGPKIAYLEDHPSIGRHIRIPEKVIDRLALDLSGVSRPREKTKEGRARVAAMV